MAQLVLRSPKAVVIVSMKVRHSSEDIFFNLMAEAGFTVRDTLVLPLPGDDSEGGDTIDVTLFCAQDFLSMSTFSKK
jgi:hypothetical protein